MVGRLRVLKWFHSSVVVFMLACLLYILYAGVTATFNSALLIAVSAVCAEGVAISLNHWQCPLTNLAERWGAEKGSVSDIFLPPVVSKNLFKYCPFVFTAEIALLGIRHFIG